MRRRGTPVVIGLAALVGLGACIWQAGLLGAASPLPVVLVAAMAVVAAALPARLTGRSDYRGPVPADAFCFALVLVAPGAAVLARATAGLIEGLRTRERTAQATSSAVLSLLVARCCYVLLTGDPFAGGDLVPQHLPAVLGAGADYLAATAVLLPARTRAGTRIARRGRRAAAAALPWITHVCAAPLILVALDFSAWLLPVGFLLVLSLHRRTSPAGREEHAALHDPVTGLPNRALFHLRYQAASQQGAPMALLLVDYRGWQEHLPAASELPVVVAERLRRTLRRGDSLARLDETRFGILAHLDPAAPSGEAERLAARITAALQDVAPAEGVTARVGMSLSPLHGTSAELLMSRAEAALHLTRAGTTWRVYDAHVRDNSPERQTLLEDLRHGLELDELELRFQPKVELASNVVVGVEALARWRHPRRGLLGPAEFIPLAESGGLIAPLTMPLLDKALAQTARWRERGWELNVAVNLSATHLGDLDLPAQVAEALRRHDVPPELLTLEVTESTIMSDPARAIAVLKQLRAQGVRTSIDDYGTGYSSLAFLRQLEVDELKIDASFIRHLAGADADELIVASTIELAHNLGLRVVAEGVEDLDAWRRLSTLHCDVVQGYLLSPPQAADELTAWLLLRRVAGNAPLPRTQITRERQDSDSRTDLPASEAAL